MITGLNHITLAVKDIEESFSFYRTVMGFIPLCKWEGSAYFLVGNPDQPGCLWFCLDRDAIPITLFPSQRKILGLCHSGLSARVLPFIKKTAHLVTLSIFWTPMGINLRSMWETGKRVFKPRRKTLETGRMWSGLCKDQ